jgi:hypothetical protein
MSIELPGRPKPWYRLGAKGVAIFFAIWIGEPLLMLVFWKWAAKTSSALFLLMIPWSLFGIIIVLQPAWAVRWYKPVAERLKRQRWDLGHWGKWVP